VEEEEEDDEEEEEDGTRRKRRLSNSSKDSNEGIRDFKLIKKELKENKKEKELKEKEIEEEEGWTVVTNKKKKGKKDKVMDTNEKNKNIKETSEIENKVEDDNGNMYKLLLNMTKSQRKRVRRQLEIMGASEESSVSIDEKNKMYKWGCVTI